MSSGPGKIQPWQPPARHVCLSSPTLSVTGRVKISSYHCLGCCLWCGPGPLPHWAWLVPQDHCAAPHTLLMASGTRLCHQKNHAFPSTLVLVLLCMLTPIYSANTKPKVPSMSKSLLMHFGHNEGALLGTLKFPPETLSMIVHFPSSYNRQNLLQNSLSFPFSNLHSAQYIKVTP